MRGEGEGGRARKEFIFVQIDKNVHIKFSKMLNNQTSFLFQPGPVDFIFYFLFFFLSQFYYNFFTSSFLPSIVKTIHIPSTLFMINSHISLSLTHTHHVLKLKEPKKSIKTILIFLTHI